MSIIRILVCLIAIVISLQAIAADPLVQNINREQERRYNTREERRDAGLKHKITEWLTFSGLGEMEFIVQDFNLRNPSTDYSQDEFSKTVQLSLEAMPWDWMKGEVIYEYDDEKNEVVLDEAIGAFLVDDFELEFGKLFVPFGEYFSSFVSGPALEFGETRGHGAILSYGPSDSFDLAVFGFDGKTEPADANDDEWNWGIAVQSALFNFGSIGAGYISNLADSEEQLLADSNNRYVNRVDGLNAYVVAGYGNFELAAEMVYALDSFVELDPDRNRPGAWNMELSWYPEGNLAWSFRLAGSRELEDAPRYQTGIAGILQIMKNMYLNVEYLYSTFDQGLAEDKYGSEIDHTHQIAGLFTVEF